MSDHDQRFKLLIKEFLVEFFKLFFLDWYDRFDFAGVVWLEQEIFLDPPQGRRSAIDLIAQIPLRPSALSLANAPRSMTVLIHIEVESDDSVEPFRVRMYDYYHYLARKFDADILPIAVYLRVGLDGRGIDAYERWFWERRVLRFEYDYVGLPALPAEEYLAGDNPLGIAWLALMKMAKERRAAVAVEAMERIAASQESPWRKLLLVECVQAYAPLDDSARIELAELLNDPKREGVRTMVKTWTEEAAERERMLILQKQIEKRFQTQVTPDMKRRIAAMSPDRCYQLAVDLLTANSLKELGLED